MGGRHDEGVKGQERSQGEEEETRGFPTFHPEFSPCATIVLTEKARVKVTQREGADLRVMVAQMEGADLRVKVTRKEGAVGG